MAGYVPWYPKELWVLETGHQVDMCPGRRNRDEVYVQAGGTGKEGQSGLHPGAIESKHLVDMAGVEAAGGEGSWPGDPRGRGKGRWGLGESLLSWQLSGLRAGQGG